MLGRESFRDWGKDQYRSTFMHDRDSHFNIEIGSDSKFVTEVDEIPIVWNYLLGLNRNDLIAELVQNDLDQDATRTIIRFEEDQLICEGNGRPVDSEGWARLRKLQGAGDSVPAKRGKIGVKNHGLKTAFAIGDELYLSSAGLKIVQTLYANGRNNQPRPGALKRPVLDPEAPDNGCRVVIKYREEEIKSVIGEAITLPAFNLQERDELFKNSCRSIPEQFIGIVSPYVVKSYEIVLKHWQLGEAKFKFSCSHPHKKLKYKRFEVFRRRCIVSGDKDSLPQNLMEEVAIRMFPLEGQLKQRVASFYQRPRNRHFVEISWQVNRKGNPKKGVGKFRYPIGYPEGSAHALTGHYTSFSAPIVSDAERHGPANNEPSNDQLRELCEGLLVDTIEFYLVRKWRANGLIPLIPNPYVSGGGEIVRPLLAKIACDGAMPTLKWEDAIIKVMNVKKRKTLSKLPSVLKRLSNEDTFVESKYRFVIPTWDGVSIDSSLAAICPRSEFQLDSYVHPGIIKLLANENTDGWTNEFITFDENDALARAKGEGNDWFPACPDQEREFAEPLIVRFYLDVIHNLLDCKDIDTDLEKNLQEVLLLPDLNVKPVRFQELYASAPLPMEIPGLTLPHVLHDALANHPIFNRKKWRRPKYSFKSFLASGGIQAADEQTKKQFWKWYCRNERKISTLDCAKLADIEIWPDIDGKFCRFSEFCVPSNRRISETLGTSIKSPHASVRKLRRITIGKKGKTSIRCVPTQDEIENWISERTAQFPIGQASSSQVRTSLNRFETELTILLKNRSIARLLKMTEIVLPSLAQDGSIQPRNELVMPSKEIERLELRRWFLLYKGSNSTPLNKLSPALSEPTVEMLLSTFKEDPRNIGALHARLSRFITLTREEVDKRLELSELPIIPVQGEYKPPCKLAFIGKGKPDYYGKWKLRIPGTGLSQDNQTRYRNVGVTSATLNQQTSIEFFSWLSKLNGEILEEQLPCVLHQVLDKWGPKSWAENYSDVPVIPTKSREGLQLVSLHTARTRQVYLPDVEMELAEAVVIRDPSVSLALIAIKGVKHPISRELKDLGVKSLRENIGEPKRVTGNGTCEEIPSELVNVFKKLNRSEFRKTIMKRFDSLGVDSDLMHHQWQSRLSAIKKLIITDKVALHYRFRRRKYTIEEKSGFDRESGVFYVDRQFSDNADVVYETIARQLIFKPAAKPMHHLMLKQALEMDFQGQSYDSLKSAMTNKYEEDAKSDNDELKGDNGDFGNDFETGEAILGHSPFEPDPGRNIPAPSSISPVYGESPNSSSKRSGSDKGSSQRTTDLNASNIEKRHKSELRDHYANHCQICLCNQDPDVLAPASSYVEWAEVRRYTMEAHHVDTQSSGGARHAGNLLLLCKYHHNNYGRRLTRSGITNALQDKPENKRINFGLNREQLSTIDGKIINLEILDEGDSVEIFFTHQHAKFWLEPLPSR